MFSSIRKILDRNRYKIIISGLSLSCIILIYKYIQYKLYQWRKKEVKELLQHSRRSQHFESTERCCNQTIINLGNCIKITILKSIDNETLINNLKIGCNDKVKCWSKLKLYSFSKPVIIIYTNTMLVITIRIQLNLLSASMFKNSQNDINNFNESLQQKYMTLCNYFMQNGIQQLINFIVDKVDEIIQNIPLTNELSIKDLEQIYWSIMSNILTDDNRNPIKNFTKYMLPNNLNNDNINDDTNNSLKDVMNATYDLLESDEVQTLSQCNIRRGFVKLIDRISEYFDKKSNCNNSISTTFKNHLSLNEDDINHADKSNYYWGEVTTIPMAKIIPILNGQLPNVNVVNDFHSYWLQYLISNEELRTFGANVYEAFSF